MYPRIPTPNEPPKSNSELRLEESFGFFCSFQVSRHGLALHQHCSGGAPATEAARFAYAPFGGALPAHMNRAACYFIDAKGVGGNHPGPEASKFAGPQHQPEH